MRIVLILPFLLLAVLCLWGQAASAQSFLGTAEKEEGKSSFVNQYSKKYKKVTDEDLENIQSKNLLKTGQYTVQFVRHPDDPYGLVNLRIESPMNIQGCGSATIPWVKVERKGKTLNIDMGEPQLVPGADMRYPHYECNISEATPSIDIPLSRNELIAYGVKQVKMKAGSVSDKFDLDLDGDNMLMIPKTATGFMPAKRANALNHVFYPVNMVILRVPAGVHDPKLAQKMDALARKHKLTPIAKPIPNAKQYQFYALDKDYNVMMPLQKRGITKLDTIEIDDILYGKNGAYTVQRDVDVFVSLPGEYD